MKRTMIAAMTVVLLVAAVGMALAHEAQPQAQAVPELTADEIAVLEQAKDLQKQLNISRLELRLGELKGEPQGEIADRATHMYRLRGELHALRVKNPALARHQWRERSQERWGRGRGRGNGPAWGQGSGEGHGRRGMGRGQGRGHGRGEGYGMGQGRGQGRGHGGCEGHGMGQGRGHGSGDCDAGSGMGFGRGRGMGRHGGRGMPMSAPSWDRTTPARNADVQTIGLEPEPEMLEQVG